MSKPAAMTPKHPKWTEFAALMEGPQGCNFRKDDKGETTWDCNAKQERPIARRLLAGFDGVDVEKSLAYFDMHGGYCDCEIAFNVA